MEFSISISELSTKVLKSYFSNFSMLEWTKSIFRFYLNFIAHYFNEIVALMCSNVKQSKENKVSLKLGGILQPSSQNFNLRLFTKFQETNFAYYSGMRNNSSSTSCKWKKLILNFFLGQIWAIIQRFSASFSAKWWWFLTWTDIKNVESLAQ